MHIGKTGLVFHDIIDDAQRVSIMIAGPLPKEWKVSESEWKRTIDRKWLDDLYDGFGDLGRNALEVRADHEYGKNIKGEVLTMG